MEKVLFDGDDRSLQQELRRAVDEYFSRARVSKHADWRMVAKSAFFLGGSALLIALLMSGVMNAWLALVVTAVLGVMLAGIGFNVGHDAIHGAYSSRPWINRVLARSFDILGASSFTWSTAHNFVHHTYTNVPGVDHDLEPGPWMLFRAHERPGFIYRFQHIYAFALYCFTTVVWLLKKDFEQIAAPDPRSGKRARTRDIVDVIFWKIAHVSLFVVLPLLVSDYSWWQVLIGYAVMHAGVGVTLAIVFQLAHVVEATQFPAPDRNRKIHSGFMAHQLRTTANFAPDSWLANFFCGGLNHQIEHHLFPKICHIHYPALASIVKDVAERHGETYRVNDTFLAALASHVRTMKRFGRPSIADVQADLAPAE
jgi:linoleoyl-CoA desaturase